MTDIFHGKVTLKVGASAGSNVNITNLKAFVHHRGPRDRVQPQTVMNTTPPVGWAQGHKMVSGEIHVLSEAQDAFRLQGVDYIPDQADNPEIPYFVATLIDTDGQTWTITVTGAIIDSVSEPYRDGEDTVWVYIWKGKYSVKTGPT